jgi:steroid delta-isomerase
LTREDNFILYFTNLSLKDLDALESYFAPNARFKDPFNDVIGVEAIRKIFIHMFSTTKNPRFVVINNAKNDDVLFLNWLFKFERNNKDWEIEGCSRISFQDDSKVSEHIDFWDPAEQIYAKVILLRPLVNFLTRLLKA